MLLDIIIIFLGFVGLIWGADKFVHGSSALAHNLGVSPLVIGLTIVAFGTSAPEIFSSAVAALEDEADLAIGNALGSNIFNVGIALGVATVIRPLTPPGSVVARELPAMMFVMVVTGLLLSNLMLGFVDALILISIITFFGWYLLTRKPESPALDDLDVEDIDSDSNLKAAGWLLFGLVLLVASAEALVNASSSVARTLGVSSAVIGLTLVALGTSLPELASTVACALRGHHDLAIGNIVGSNILNLLVVLPFPGLLDPGGFDASLLYRDYVTMLVLSLLLTIMCCRAVRKRTVIGRASGLFLILVYAGWVTIMYWQL